MGAHEFETVLARLYVDAPFRRHFLTAPEDALAGSDLSEEEKKALAGIDRAGLILAAGSYARKRADRMPPRRDRARSRFARIWSGILTRLRRR